MAVSIEDFFQCQVPPELWHYTSLDGLRGILSSGTVWATEAHATKDFTEFVHAKAVCDSYMGQLKPIDDHEMYAIKQAHDIVESAFADGALSTGVSEVFVASFSAARDLKSQWIEFADGGRGVSIAFDLTDIRPPKFLNIAVTLAPCLYEAADKRVLIASALSTFISVAAEALRWSKDLVRIGNEMQRWAYLDSLYGRTFDKHAFHASLLAPVTGQLDVANRQSLFDLLRSASHCKNEQFAEEHEWRLALPRLKGKPLYDIEIKYRGSNGEIPYIASNLFSQTGKLPITGIILGPFCEEEEEVASLLKANGYDVPIEKSDVPYRK